MGEQLKQQPRREETEEVPTDMPHVESDVKIEDIDKMLDEIDLILETNPEEFVAAYQQRGGQ